MTLLNSDNKSSLERIASKSKHINLGGNPKYNENNIDHMLFGDE